jgi:hypothetical protein
MPAFRFQEDKSLDANWTAFMAEMQSVDPQLAAILAANKDKLIAVVTQGNRDARARGEFNAAIASALDAIVTAENAGSA